MSDTSAERARSDASFAEQYGPWSLVAGASEGIGAAFARLVIGMPFNAVVREGEPHSEIVAAAEELATDLIVLSTHGRTGIAHVFLGSTAEKVVRHAGCPVLIVREREHEFTE